MNVEESSDGNEAETEGESERRELKKRRIVIAFRTHARFDGFGMYNEIFFFDIETMIF